MEDVDLAQPQSPEPISASSVSAGPGPTLRELHARHDVLWRAFVATPIEERREWSKKGYDGDSEACRLYRELQSLNERILPLQRDFEAEVQPALRERAQDDDFARDLYRALCNQDWEHRDGSRYSCSWRYAGGLVADLRDQGEDYLDFYCSGGEGQVSPEVEEALADLGWHPLADPEDDGH